MRKKNFFLKKGDIKFLSVKNVTIDLQKSMTFREGVVDEFLF